MLVHGTTVLPTSTATPAAGTGRLSSELVSEASVPQTRWTSENLSCLSAGLDQVAAESLERLSAQRLRIKCHAAFIGSAKNSASSTLCAAVRAKRRSSERMGSTKSWTSTSPETSSASMASAAPSTSARRRRWRTWRSAFWRTSECFGHNLHRLLAQESGRAHALMLMLGTMRAEKRLAAFLLDLSRRYQIRGFSACEFVLRMTREEIGSYLGLTLETVSRLFSRFQQEGVLEVQARSVKLDLTALAHFVDQARRPVVRAGPGRDACLERGVVFAERRDGRRLPSRRQA